MQAKDRIARLERENETLRIQLSYAEKVRREVERVRKREVLSLQQALFRKGQELLTEVRRMNALWKERRERDEISVTAVHRNGAFAPGDYAENQDCDEITVVDP